MKGISLVLAALVAASIALSTGIAFAQEDGQESVETHPGAIAPSGEIPAARTATSQTFQLPDGQLETRLYENPVNYRGAGGRWTPIGEGLEEQPDGSGLTNGPNSFDVTLPERLGNAPVRLSAGDQWVATRLLGAPTETVQLEGGTDTASYEAAKSAASFDLSTLANGVKEDIELAAPDASNRFSFALSASEGLTPKLAEDGSVVFGDAEGKPAILLPAPTVSDSSPEEPIAPGAAHYELEPEGKDGWRLTVEVDRAWLEDPKRNFPAYLDPTLTVPAPTLDCMIGGTKEGKPVNWGACGSKGKKELLAAYWAELKAEEEEWQRTLFRFDLSAIPKGAEVESATFGAYAFEAAKNTQGVELREVTKAWDSEATWTKYDKTGSLWSAEGGDYSTELAKVLTSERGTAAGWWKFGLAAKSVQKLVSAGESLSFLAKLTDDKSRECSEEGCTHRVVRFYSSAAEPKEDRPYLSATYSVPTHKEPIASYNFDEGTGTTAHDGSGNGHDGTVEGAEWTKEGRYGGALRFEPAKKARVVIPDADALDFSATNNLTLTAWVRPEEERNWSPIFAKTGTESSDFAYLVYARGTGVPKAQLKNAAGTSANVWGKEALPQKAWSHLAVSSDGAYLRIYVNGELAGTEPTVVPRATTSALRIGGNEQWGEYFNGKIDNVRIYDRALSQTEIKADELEKPSGTTEAATGLTATEATLKGSVNPNGSATTYQFEYGTTTSYGTKVPTSPASAGSGTSPVAESKAATGLTEGTTYHYRVAATNESGTSYGEDKTFATLKLPTATTEGATSVKEKEATLKASVNPNGSATTYQFEYGTTTSYGTKVPVSPESAGSGTSAVAVSKAISGLTEGTTYHYRVVASSAAGTANGTDQTLKTIQPPQTTITSPQRSYIESTETTVSFTSDKPESTFKCKLEGPALTEEYACTSPRNLTGLNPSDQYTFEVTATDSEGHADPTSAKWTFNTGIYPPAPSTSKLISPEEGEKTASYYTLQAEWGNAPEGGGVTGVTFQVKLHSFEWKEPFQTVPAECVRDQQGQQVSWPIPVSENPGQTDPVFFGIKDCPALKWKYLGEGIKFRALFDGGPKAAGASEPVQTEFSLDYYETGAPTDATEQVGPANLDLLTGNYTISRTDVSIPVPGSEASLEFTRNYESFHVGLKVQSHILGQEWQPSGPMEQEFAGEAWTELQERHENEVPAQYDPECEKEGYSHEECLVEEGIPAADWIEILDNEGNAASFEIQGGSYIAPDYMKEYVLTKHGTGASTSFELAAPEGTHTLFTKNEVGIEGSYRMASVSWQATAKSARMVYEHVEGTGDYQMSKMIAPAPAGVTCSDAEATHTAGCRTLTFQYRLCEPNCKSGGYTRLTSITYFSSSGKEAEAKVVAKYEYDSSDRLIAEWDPRLSPCTEGKPCMKEKYTYSGTRLLTLTPAGQEPWEFAYDNHGLYNGRLKSVSRASAPESSVKAKTTIAYEVPISGSGAPYNLSAESVAEWGQTDYPVNATAIFPPTEVPSEPPSSYSKATIQYLDPDGYIVNTVSPQVPGVEGLSLSTTETDRHGNVVRSLSPQNRLLALAAGTEKVARSHELDSHSTYSADGTEMLESFGPLHKVRLESGTTIEARAHTVVEYDKEAPTPKEGEAAPHMPTSETTSARLSNGEDVEARTTVTEYDWTLRRPTETILDAAEGGLKLATRTAYDKETGLPTESSMPGKPAGGDAHTTKFVYYTASGDSKKSPCFKNKAWAGLLCEKKPAAQPGTAGLPELLVTKYKAYNSLDEPTEIVESPGGKEEAEKTRKTITAYDEAGRVTNSRQVGGGKELAPTATVYSEATGAPVEQHLVCESKCEGFDEQAVVTAYDKLGRPVKYTDADGSTSETTYDLMGRPATVFDGKGTQTFGYDETSGLLVAMEDSAIGIFTAAYNAGGAMTEVGLPNGLVAKATYDEAGQSTGLSYVKATSCSEKCTWLEESEERSIHGQVLKRNTLSSSQQYSYDKAGRLTLAKDTQEGSCTTRIYAFEGEAGKDSNRTSMTTRAPGVGGACASEGGTTQSYSYDAADRLTGEGIAYDSFGRITSLPGKYAGGSTLETTFYSNEMLVSQTQNGLTNSYQLDATGRVRQVTQSGTKEGTEVFHYAGGSDAPVWTERGSEWTRNIGGIGGELAAIQESGKEPTLQLTDLHGDVVATASLSSSAKEPIAKFEFDEFGNPVKGSAGRFGWLGAKQRRAELPSGVVQMGRRSYVPAVGRFISTDPIVGGSANAYDYANADPVNGFDLGGTDAMSSHDLFCRGRVHAHTHHGRYERGGYGRVKVRFNVYCARRGESMHAVSITTKFSGPRGTIYEHHMGIPELAHNDHVNHSGEVEIGNYKKPNPLSYQCLQGATYEWTIEVEMWVTANGCELCDGFVHTFQLHAKSICRG